MSATTEDSGRKYHLVCTGAALETVNKHQDDVKGITLFGSCFCPFVQRAWVALEYFGITYRYCMSIIDQSDPITSQLPYR